MNVLFVKTIQSYIKRNTYINGCVKYSNLRIFGSQYFNHDNRKVPHMQ